MIEKEIWQNETRLWLEGASAYDELLHPKCIMVFSAPVGIMQGSVIAESIKGAQRWKSVAMTEQSFCQCNSEAVVLAYRAEGHREGSAPYFAYCSSTYIRQDHEWRIIQHQQTPIS